MTHKYIFSQNGIKKPKQTPREWRGVVNNTSGRKKVPKPERVRRVNNCQVAFLKLGVGKIRGPRTLETWGGRAAMGKNPGQWYLRPLVGRT